MFDLKKKSTLKIHLHSYMHQDMYNTGKKISDTTDDMIRKKKE